MKVHIITDSSADFDFEEYAALDIDFLPLHVAFRDKDYLDVVNLSHADFYKMLIESDELPKSGQVAPYEFGKLFKSIAEKGDTAVCITISSGLSGTYQSALIAAADYPGVIRVVDSENTCIAQRILVERALELRSRDLSAKEIAAILESEKKDIRIIALLDTLTYLKKGGRIPATVATVGTLLTIKPVITMDLETHKIKLAGQARGSKNGNNKLNELVAKSGGIDFSKPLCLAYSGLSDALLRKYIEDSSSLYEGQLEKLPVATIGCAVGSHCGPGTIAFAFYRKS